MARLAIPAASLAFFSLFSHATLSANNQLESFQGEYTGVYKGTTITLNRDLKALGNNKYTLSNKAKNALASLTEKSNFSLSNSHVMRPSRYEYIAKYGPIKRGQDVVFDWNKKRAVDKKDKDKVASFAQHSSVADRLSYQAQIRQMLKAGKRGTIKIPVVSRGKLKTYTYKTQPEVKLKTKAGTFNAIPVKRVYSKSGKTQTVWMAKDYDFVLLKLRQTDDKEKYEISLSKGAVAGKTLK